MDIVRINAIGVLRVLDGEVGMHFIVDHYTQRVDGGDKVAQVRDYRFADNYRGFQLWSIGTAGYEVVK